MTEIDAAGARRMSDIANGYAGLLEAALASIAWEAGRGSYEATPRRHPRDRAVSRQLVRDLRQRGFKVRFYLNTWLRVRW